MQVLKFVAPNIAPSVTKLFNLSIKTELFPISWESSHIIVAIPKCSQTILKRHMLGLQTTIVYGAISSYTCSYPKTSYAPSGSTRHLLECVPAFHKAQFWDHYFFSSTSMISPIFSSLKSQPCHSMLIIQAYHL